MSKYLKDILRILLENNKFTNIFSIRRAPELRISSYTSRIGCHYYAAGNLLQSGI